MKEDEILEKEADSVDTSLEEKSNYATKEEISAEFKNAYTNIPNFHNRLVYFTLSKIRYYFGTNSFRGLTADDVVQKVIKSILTLDRKWYKNKIPGFHKFVRLSILSFIRNERKKKDKLDLTELHDEDGNLTLDSTEEIVKQYSREDAAEKYFRDDFESLVQKCVDELQDDVYAVFVLEERCNGLRSNIKIAEKLGIEVREVENAIKRIKNKFRKLNAK